MDNRKTLGKLGEDFACSLLESKKYEILERNYRCKMGEIDIIAKRDNTISMIEVKTRQSLLMGDPAEAVNPAKQHKIRMSALSYLQKNNIQDAEIEFQVMEIFVNRIENAF